MAHWFTADPHLGHHNIIRLANRPFSSTEEMDNTIINNINEATVPGDTLYILGDFTIRCDESTLHNYRNRINCKQIVFIRGNHDSRYLDRVFRFVRDLHTIKIDGQRITLCHYAMRTWPSSHTGTWHLYGHSHGNLADDPNALSLDVGVDCHDFHPLSLPHIKALMSNKTFVPIDHHGSPPEEHHD